MSSCAVPEKFRVLGIVVDAIMALSVLVLLIAFWIALEAPELPMLARVGVALSGVFSGVLGVAFSQAIEVFIDMERNQREILAELVNRK